MACLLVLLTLPFIVPKFYFLWCNKKDYFSASWWKIILGRLWNLKLCTWKWKRVMPMIEVWLINDLSRNGFLLLADLIKNPCPWEKEHFKNLRQFPLAKWKLFSHHVESWLSRETLNMLTFEKCFYCSQIFLNSNWNFVVFSLVGIKRKTTVKVVVVLPAEKSWIPLGWWSKKYHKNFVIGVQIPRWFPRVLFVNTYYRGAYRLKKFPGTHWNSF